MKVGHTYITEENNDTVERARKGIVTEEIVNVSGDEAVAIEVLREYVASGKVVIPSNKNRAARVIGIGKDLRTKMNASIGTSTEIADIDMEVEKARIK